jgi:eukaryotic-like serine/threonine-protein kinase
MRLYFGSAIAGAFILRRVTRSNGEQLRTGATLARYRIIERIGAGGMGEVYRARDLDLDRDVAIKVLPSDVTGSEERVRRFVQEAKAASGLNHPNIVVIHEIGAAEADGVKHHFIAMELIEGETLRAKIHKPHRDLKALLGHAAQAADALAKAHAAGIVHRDLKPDNLMITRDGFAKVLDFGLAKLTEARPSTDASATQVRPDTRDGMVLGTIGYMSPEQAQGFPVDARSDIFSFGCILYEIATGERPFKGSSQVDVLHAIVHNDPAPVTDINPNIPPELRRIVRRCLAKDPDQRFQSMKDLANTLRDLVDEYDQLTPGSGSTMSAAAIAAAQKKPRAWPWVAGVAVVIAIVALAMAWKRKHDEHAAPPQLEIKQITSSGQVNYAAVSPDGRYVAYTLNVRGDSGIRVRQIATGSEVEVRPQTREFHYGELRFSPDGEHLYLLRNVHGSSYRELMIMPTLGGEPRKLVYDVDTRPAISPDGKRVAFIRFTRSVKSEVIVADTAGGNERTISVRNAPEQHINVEWLPDGTRLAVAVASAKAALEAWIETMNPDGSDVQRFTKERWFAMGHFQWLPDGSGAIVNGLLTEARGAHLWLISARDGKSKRITSDLVTYEGVNVTADSAAIVTVRAVHRPRIVRVDLATGESAALTDDRETRVPTWFSLGSDGSILYQETEGGTMDVWMRAPDGSTPRQITNDPAAEFNPKAAPDGTIYYQHEDERGLTLMATNRNGGAPREIARLPPNDTGSLELAPDGRSILYTARPGLLRIDTQTGAVKELSKLAVNYARFSPDGSRIAFTFSDPDPKRRVNQIIDARTGAVLQELPRTADQTRVLEWMPDGRSLLVVEHTDGLAELWTFPLDGSARRQLSRFNDSGMLINTIAVTPDRKSVLVGQASEIRDVVKITNFR